MSNTYNGQQWNQNQLNFGPLQLEQEFDFGDRQQQQRRQQQQQQPQQSFSQQSYGSPDAYAYQQPLPATANSSLHSSSLDGAFRMGPTNQQQSHILTSSGANNQGQLANMAGFVHDTYSSPQSQVKGLAVGSSPYLAQSTSFDFTNTTATTPMSMQGVDSGRNANFKSSAGVAHQVFPQASTSNIQPSSSYYNPPTTDSSVPKAKRQHIQAFNTDSVADDQFEDGDAGADQKDGKKQLSRACARCKALKVKCEAKTDTEPCKRCYNGGHECIIPGRKIRRTPPKREHLISQIQSQAQEIERLMRELEKVSASSKRAGKADQNDASSSLHSPVLSPSSTSTSYFGGSDSHSTGAVGEDATSPDAGLNPNNSAANKAVEDWIAKARESLHEFGAFIGIGGADMPKSYLVEEDLEGHDDSGEDDFVDVAEELGDDEDRYEVAVEHPDGDHDMSQPQGGIRLQHKSSASSLGTVATNGPTRKKNGGDMSKPANLPVEAAPFGLFGNLSLKRSGSQEPEAEEDKGPGIANENFFKPTAATNALGRRVENAQHQAPAILTRGIISPQEAEALFKIYFDNMNLSVSLLDPVLYTAQRTFYRSPFLFTVICAIASRFYTARPGLYTQVMHYAQLAAGTALISGNKNVEMCQAYILLSLYPVPARKWEDQRSWLYLGLAIRAATDLNLHLPTTAKPLSENHAREMLNRTRVWLNCFNLDRSTGSQYGKPPIISPKDYMANHSENWFASSPYNMANFDIHISAYNSELKVMANFIAKIYSDADHPTGLNKEVDFEAIATATDDELKALGESWMTTIHAQTDLTDPQSSFRTGLLKLAYSYSRLIALSYGFQHAFGKNDGKDENPFLMRCLSAASDVVNAVVKDICRPSQIHYFRHGPEAQSVFVTFASAFLVKLLQPKFASYLAPEIRVEIRSLVQQVIDLLGSPEVAIDERHGPKLYSRFLEKLLAKPMAKLDLMSPGSTSSTNIPLPQMSGTPLVRGAKSRRPKSASGGTPGSASSLVNSFDLPTTVYNHPSPTSSLSPPPTEAALSFEIFAPVGGIDPFATENAAAAAMNLTQGSEMTNVMNGGMFQPSLPFDDAIVQSWQSLTNPDGWNDISMPDPGFNWMTQFQQNLGMDLSGSSGTYEDSMYMTGPSKH